MSFPIGYWNGLAACIAIGLVLLVWLSAESASRRWRAIAIAMIPVGGTALFFTSSRGGVIATVLGVAVLAAFGRNRAQILAGAALGGVATVALALLATGRYDLMHDLGTSVQRTQGLELAVFMVALGGAIGWIRWRLDGWLATLSLSRRVTRLGLLGVAVATIVLVVSINPATVVTDLSRESPTPTSETGQRGLFGTGASGRTEFWVRHSPPWRVTRSGGWARPTSSSIGTPTRRRTALRAMLTRSFSRSSRTLGRWACSSRSAPSPRP